MGLLKSQMKQIRIILSTSKGVQAVIRNLLRDEYSESNNLQSHPYELAHLFVMLIGAFSLSFFLIKTHKFNETSAKR